jgi:hypothetical protein
MARYAAAAFLIAMFALNVYRAATQSFVTDEAYSYSLYVGREPFNLFRQYDANLHVLHTFATWCSVRLFGWSELAFRLPTLIGCALYFAAVYRIAQRTAWIAVLLLVANPLLEDHMSAGRGYGLALAWFAWAYLEVLREPVRLTRIAVFLSLSVATNLTFLFPAAGLMAALMWRNRSLLLESLAGPFTVLTALMVALPFSNMAPGSLYYGAESIDVMLHVMTGASLGEDFFPSAIRYAGAVILIAGCVAAAIYHDLRKEYSATFFATATMTVTAAALVVSHVLLNVAYPWTRTGLYLLFLVPLCFLPLTRWKWVNLPLAAVGIYMALQINPRHYQEWDFDASNREIMDRIEQRHKEDRRPVRIAATSPTQFTFEMYRKIRGLDWIVAIDSGKWEPGYDYYVFTDVDFERVKTMGLRELDWPLAPKVKVAIP